MNKSRVLVLGIAFLTAAGAALLARNFVSAPSPERVVETRFMNTTKVLIASQPIKIGQLISPGQLTWQTWPKDALNSSFVMEDEQNTAKQDFDKAIARATFAVGEPINKFKLIKKGQGGVMAAILMPGMRAISTKIKEATSAGGFILPNDRVDVILSYKINGRNETKYASNTILANVRVLAIGQNIEQPKGEASTIGKTATLELTQRQAETLARAEYRGEISLALRSMSGNPDKKYSLSGDDAEGQKKPPLSGSNNGDSGIIRMMKFGRRVQDNGVQ